ncbi:alpha/beta hydrolase [Jatrophihabitans endophyticus]|uniref:alpha/beta hydrolase n=1 Tax=Jatrophihabitans endophyticus TaxID=1206085 RepID=UPI0019DD8B09|nr:alpha/beta fold hydrolase [Jatrophihabitans endophyticus]MBE7188232.1 alpha/beta fold hydrolase [Jatrophihabitans endophyticus]
MANTASLVCLHGLGLSAHLFDPVAAELGDGFDVLALDLPGFGGAPAPAGTSVAATADAVVQAIVEHAPARWLLVGHSMGGKIASVVARRALDGEPGLFGFAGVVLLAGSPPSPEPMDDDQRATMLGWAADGPLSAQAARTFVDDNVGAPLPADLDALALGDLQRCSREAWVAWLERGSREDRSTEVGTLDVPALILAGGADGPLGEDGQRRCNAPVYPRAQVVTLPGAGHLLPLERPREVADAITRFWREHAGRGPAVPPGWVRAIASERVSTRTRGILAERALADDPAYRPSVLDDAQLRTLRLLAELVVPQDGGPDERIDLAARVDAQLAAGGGDGWRHDTLPPDVEAYRAALDALGDLAELGPDEQHDRLEALADGTFTDGTGTPVASSLSAAQLALWFEDARSDLALLWVAHPATMAAVGFDGYLTGAGGRRLLGWQLLGAGEREQWEPAGIA